VAVVGEITLDRPVVFVWPPGAASPAMTTGAVCARGYRTGCANQPTDVALGHGTEPVPITGELPFEAFGQFGPGRLDLRVLDQDTRWVDIYAVPHVVDGWIRTTGPT
jgi:hypothetical protein